jgi:hypothetical protein
MNTIATIQRFLRAVNICGVSGKKLIRAIKHLFCFLQVSRHDSHPKPRLFQMARHGLSQYAGSTDNQDCLLHNCFLLRDLFPSESAMSVFGLLFLTRDWRIDRSPGSISY